MFVSNADTARGSRRSIAPRRLSLVLAFEAEVLRAEAAAPTPRRLADSLAALLTDGAQVAQPAPARAAARAFAAGTGFLPGQMIDRAI